MIHFVAVGVVAVVAAGVAYLGFSEPEPPREPVPVRRVEEVVTPDFDPSRADRTRGSQRRVDPSGIQASFEELERIFSDDPRVRDAIDREALEPLRTETTRRRTQPSDMGRAIDSLERSFRENPAVQAALRSERKPEHEAAGLGDAPEPASAPSPASEVESAIDDLAAAAAALPVIRAASPITQEFDAKVFHSRGGVPQPGATLSVAEDGTVLIGVDGQVLRALPLADGGYVFMDETPSVGVVGQLTGGGLPVARGKIERRGRGIRALLRFDDGTRLVLRGKAR